MVYPVVVFTNNYKYPKVFTNSNLDNVNSSLEERDVFTVQRLQTQQKELILDSFDDFTLCNRKVDPITLLDSNLHTP